VDDPPTTPGTVQRAGSAALPTAPPVVAVVVARDPGEWFEQTLAGLRSQDYPSLSILVIDAGSVEPVRSRVAAAAPGAYVHQLGRNPGFGAAANEVLELVEGAAFYLFCHDDVVLEPDTVRVLVEEAFRSNAGLVGPKIVDWHDPRRLLSVGEGSDRTGHAAPYVERHELDQQQRDAVSDVFNIPGACTLVRADLFEAIGGFDEGIDFLLDDLSLCWRAHLAGARVLVAPQARVRHLEALGARRPVDDRRRLQSRHRLRILLTCSSGWSLLRLLPWVAVLQVLEAVYSFVVGRTDHARELASAWTWNLRRLGEIRAARRQVRAFRQVSDRELHRHMVRGSARLSQFLRGQIGRGNDRLSGLAEGGRGVLGGLSTQRASLGVGAAVAVLLVIGSRHLITQGVPAVGELAPLRSGPVELARTWLSGWRDVGLGSTSPAPTGLAVLAVGGAVLGGAMDLLRLLLTVGLIPLGALAAYRLPGPLASRRARIAALVTYVSIPLPYNALASGRWGALAAYAAMPVLLGQLARASRLAPFGPVGGSPGPTVRPLPWWGRVLALGVVAALVATLVPAVVVMLPLLALTLVAGSLLALTVRGALRVMATAGGAAAVAAVLHLPWALDFILPGATISGWLGPERVHGTYAADELLRFATGPLGHGALGWAVLVAAALPLLVGNGWRHTWAVRCWTVALAWWALAWAAEEGVVPVGLPPAEVLLVPAAAALALAVALGVSAFEVDLPGYRFGWRQLASGAAALALALATLPVLGAVFDGRWGMPSGDHVRALSFLDAERDQDAFRVLWLGDPEVLPLGSWDLGDGVSYATTSQGTPRVEELWAGSDDGTTRLLADAIELARDRQTSRLGRLLAPMAVRYVVVAERPAPAPFSTVELPVPADLSATLALQLDLRRIDVPAGLTVYENEAYLPLVAAGPPGLGEEAEGIAEVIRADLGGATAVLDDEGHARWRGTVPDGSRVLLSATAAERWELSVDGVGAERSKSFGWANAFEVGDGGLAELHYRTPATRYGMLAIQALLWLLAVRSVLAARVRAREVR
jgi:GT2 family glycosyltransferase